MGIGTGTAALIGGVASAGAGIAGSAMQAGAAKSAAQTQAQAAQQAMALQQQNAQQAVGYQNAALQNVTNVYSPYYTAGQQGLTSLASALAPGGSLAQNWTQQFQAPTAAQAAATPGYQFALQQGLNAVQSSAAAQGNLLSGGTMKALNNYAQGMASTNYQQTYNNAFNQYLQNYNQFQTNQANQYARLMGLTGVGQQATSGLAGAQQSIASNIGNILTGTAQTQSQALQNAAAAQASGMVGSANAWAGGLNTIGGAAQGYGNALATQALYQRILGNTGGGGTGFTPNLTGLTGGQISGIYGGPSSVPYSVGNTTGSLSQMVTPDVSSLLTVPTNYFGG